MAGMVNIGEMGALALHVLVELAVLREEDPAARRTIQHIAGRLRASSHTLQKVSRRLIMMELIDGARGASGGLRLAVDPGRISLLEVIEGVEGKFDRNNCMFAKRVCPPSARCAFAQIAGNMEQMLRRHFSATTIADLRAESMQTA